MWNFLKKIFIGEPSCNHKWEVMNTWTVSKRRRYYTEWVACGTRYAMQCKHCGNIKEVKVGECD